MPPMRSQASSPRCGAKGPTSFTSVTRSACVAPALVSVFRYSISPAMAVLNCIRSRSAVTRLMVLWRSRSCGSPAGARADVPLLAQAPDALQEPVHALDGARVPGLGQLELAHEHLVEAHHVGAVVADDVVGVDAVQLGLRHLLDGAGQRLARRLQHGGLAAELDLAGLVVSPQAVLVAVRQHGPLVAQLLERLLRVHQAHVVEHLVPEARVQQVQHGVLAAAHVQVDGHPFLLGAGLERAARRPSATGTAGSTSTSPPTAASCWSRAAPGRRTSGRWSPRSSRCRPAATRRCPSARRSRRRAGARAGPTRAPARRRPFRSGPAGWARPSSAGARTPSRAAGS